MSLIIERVALMPLWDVRIAGGDKPIASVIGRRGRYGIVPRHAGAQYFPSMKVEIEFASLDAAADWLAFCVARDAAGPGAVVMLGSSKH